MQNRLSLLQIAVRFWQKIIFPVFMKSVLLTFFTILITSFLFRATAQQTPSEEKIYVTAEQMPEFVGGQDSMMAYIARNVRYPQEALSNRQEGVAIISFVVNSSGKTTQPQVLKSAAPSLDAEAIRIINGMPLWKPGKQNGNAVAVRFTLPVRFQFAPEAAEKQVTDSLALKNLEQPVYPGGEAAMLKFLAKNIKYPIEAQQNKIEGLSVITFVVDQNGGLGTFRVLKALGYGTDQEAIRVLQRMPKWIPGKVDGKPVKVRFTLPVRFSM